MKEGNPAIGTKNGAALTPSYEDFEPLCNWRRIDENETLEIHLPEFKKEELKVQLSSLQILRISGEHRVDETTRRRFHKEIIVPKDFNGKEIHAEFAAGNHLLHIVMPKKAAASYLASEQEKQPPQKSTKDSTITSQNDDQVNKLTNIYQQDSPVMDSRSKCSFNEAITNVVVVVVFVAFLAAYLMVSYHSLCLKC